MEVFIVDSARVIVPTASKLVTFSVKGAGVNAGVGNRDPASHELNQASARSAFACYAMVLGKSNTKPGEITLTATADGLAPQTLTFQTA